MSGQWLSIVVIDLLPEYDLFRRPKHPRCCWCGRYATKLLLRVSAHNCKTYSNKVCESCAAK